VSLNVCGKKGDQQSRGEPRPLCYPVWQEVACASLGPPDGDLSPGSRLRGSLSPRLSFLQRVPFTPLVLMHSLCTAPDFGSRQPGDQLGVVYFPRRWGSHPLGFLRQGGYELRLSLAPWGRFWSDQSSGFYLSRRLYLGAGHLLCPGAPSIKP